ncbi:MAG: hypothetical protein K8R48_07080 [Alphaproteobacteria bacterium]|nr:hypothetical protein [Alphaproteobacteria bacterium]
MNPRLIALLTAALLVSGCTATQALKDMKQSRTAYKACLAQHPKDASTACKRQKISYETASQAYTSMARGSNGLDAGTSRD